jgi:protein TonB
MARELEDDDRPKTHTLPVWLAAAALLAVTAIAAVLLLRDAPDDQPAETRTSTALSAPVAPPPVAPPTPAPGLQFEKLEAREPAQPPTSEPVRAEPVQALKAHDDAEPSRKRKRAALRERDQTPAEARPAPREEPVRAKPKNAGDLLGF